MRELVAIVPGEFIRSTYPHEALAILENRSNHARRKPLFPRDVIKLDILGLNSFTYR